MYIYVYIHTYMRTYTNTDLCTCTHTDVNVCVYTFTQTHTHTRARTHTHTRVRVQMSDCAKSKWITSVSRHAACSKYCAVSNTLSCRLSSKARPCHNICTHESIKAVWQKL